MFSPAVFQSGDASYLLDPTEILIGSRECLMAEPISGTIAL